MHDRNYFPLKHVRANNVLLTYCRSSFPLEIYLKIKGDCFFRLEHVLLKQFPQRLAIP
jgi:hypothetical protein